MAYGNKARLARTLGIAPTMVSDYLAVRKDAPSYRAREIGRILGCDFLLFAKQAKSLSVAEQKLLSSKRWAAYREWAGE